MEIQKKTTTILLAVILCTSLFGLPTQEIFAGTTLTPPQDLLVKRVTKTQIQLSWKNVSGASGYIIYKYNNKKKKYTAIKNIKSNSIRKWKDKKLKPGKVYRYKMKSYKVENGKKTYSKFTYNVSSKTYIKGDKKVNAGKVKLDEYGVRLAMNKKYRAYADPKPTKKYPKVKGKKLYNKKIRWRSDNSNVATVDKKGRITTHSKVGKCNIYAIAHNGRKAKMEVTVVDYANPPTFNLSKVNGPAKSFIMDNEDGMREIARYFLKNKPTKDLYFDYDDEFGYVKFPYTYDIEEIEDTIKAMVERYKDDFEIFASDYWIEFTIREETGIDPYGLPIIREHRIYFMYETEVDRDEWEYPVYEIAPGWCYGYEDYDY